MGSSMKKKKEKAKDFQKPKLKVGKARPKNTNATDTSFAAKSIVLKQQSLTESGRDATALFNHNLSLLNSKNDAQRKDVLTYLTNTVAASPGALPQPPSVILSKAQPLILDGSAAIRSQVLKLFKVLPKNQIGSLDQALLYTRAGMTHLSADIRNTSLDVMDWLLETNGEAIVSVAGGWVRTLQTFQNLLSWHGSSGGKNGATITNGNWTATKTTTNLGSNKLLVHQLSTLGRFLMAGLSRPTADPEADARRAAALFPLWQSDAHMLPQKSNPYGYLNLFGAPRDVDGEVYDDPEERMNVFVDLDLHNAFQTGVKEAKAQGGEVGRAASSVDKALKLVGATG
ncbi:unnamed protein product [Zymoseptoria tritici ST99CH_1E4]|uniref:Pre-rRNA-processing protein n=1 Tax=Zymoseptoria tritici ST99CH_1E4 TaxID=1276532 RepID=A0A2H1GF84_ZYMTR|nr:unnamed protein product [Zymoseptoria tritici ST99CH_1E4]